ncbi:MAG TPA: MFS transporter [Gammaproteobacteria bacterium]|nr:MFS transporter [Gammaproteobacteria bacterium]
MFRTLTTIPTLLFGIGILLLGSGFLGTLLGIRAGLENFPTGLTGLIMAAFFAGYIIGTYLCPPLIRRFGHIRSFTAMASLAGATVLVHAMVVNPAAWMALRIVTGVCMVGLYMVIESWLSEQTAAQRRGRVFSVYMTVNLLALGASQYLILVYGAVGAAPFALSAVFFSIGLIPIALTRVIEPRLGEPTAAFGLRRLYAVSPLSMMTGLISGLGNGAFWGLGAVFAHDVGLSNAGIAAFMSATVIGGALLQGPIGHQSDRWDRRIVLMIVSFAGAAAAAIAFVLIPVSHPGLIVAAVVYGGFGFSIYSLGVAHMNDHLGPGEVLEATRGVLLVTGIGATLGPVIGGLLMQYVGPRSLMAFFGVILLVLGLYALRRMWVSPAIPAEEQGEFVPMARTSGVVLEMDPRTDEEPPADPVEPTPPQAGEGG